MKGKRYQPKEKKANLFFKSERSTRQYTLRGMCVVGFQFFFLDVTFFFRILASPFGVFSFCHPRELHFFPHSCHIIAQYKIWIRVNDDIAFL